MRDGRIRLCAHTKGHYPSITTIGHFSGVGAQYWGTESHRNEGLEITFFETGSMAFSVEPKNYELRPGHFTTTRPWQLHKLGAPDIGPGKLHWLIPTTRMVGDKF
jgi:AraC family L-rhamnose operon regulatory protein RhaS